MRNDPAKAELSIDRRGMNWNPADVKIATRKRNKARKAKPGTVFTSDPQSYHGSYSYNGTTRAH